MQIDFGSTLKDSTSADVPFNFVFTGTTAPGTPFPGSFRALIRGSWIFEGGTPVSPGNGPTLTALPGSLVRVSSAFSASRKGGGRITLKNNTSDIVSTPATLIFEVDTYFNLDNNPGGAIPNAYWEADIINPRFPYEVNLQYPAATILITGNIKGNLRHLASVIIYPRLVVDLSALAADASLALKSGSLIWGNLEILNTNSHTLTLLADTARSGIVQVEVGRINNGIGSGGYLNISGSNTKVALARATSAAPGTSYRLQVDKGFNQSGGNFSLQDADEATGSSTLAIRYDPIQTGGTFITNSTATDPDTKFIVIMDDPPMFQTDQEQSLH